ncbi:MAG: 50S ribosomal protein L24 [Planctomycetales bacterium]|nr:50S ribosomal protein L24 [Planctomycetales bacterium]
MHVRMNDEVQVIAGDDRGKRGRVIRVDRERSRVIVEGLHYVWKHVRRTPQAPQGGRLQREGWIAAASVLPYCGPCGRGRRIRHLGEGTQKVRVCAKCQQPVGATK